MTNNTQLYGTATGETGNYGVGDIVEGTKKDLGTIGGCWTLSGEPVHSIFYFKNEVLIYHYE